ncbi:MAG: hypothetical protein Q7R49_01880 [Candidatus Daviesbacteria bacterium]|nr:hypothetical protein [Candidatus Daviesbacteria bacterium]
MLESLSQTNIGSLNLTEAPNPDLPFDPKRDLTERDWAEIKKYSEIESLDHIIMSLNLNLIPPEIKERRIYFFCGAALNVHKISPDRMTWFRENEEMWDLLKAKLEASTLNINYLTGIAKIVWPEKYPDLNIDSSRWTQSENQLKMDLERYGPAISDYWLAISDAAEMKIHHPEVVAKQNFTGNFLAEAIEGLEGIKADGMQKEFGGFWGDQPPIFDYFQYLQDFRVLFSERFKQIPITQSTWQEGKRQLQKEKRKNVWFEFLSLAGSMMICEAEEVQITEQGFKITMPYHDNAIPTPALPEIRKF